jgi:hypothetical protein
MFVITAQTDNDDTKFMANDFSGRPYWSSLLASAQQFQSIKQAQQTLLSADFTVDVKQGNNMCPPRLLHSGAKLGDDKPSGNVIISIEQISLKNIHSDMYHASIKKIQTGKKMSQEEYLTAAVEAYPDRNYDTILECSNWNMVDVINDIMQTMFIDGVVDTDLANQTRELAKDLKETGQLNFNI